MLQFLGRGVRIRGFVMWQFWGGAVLVRGDEDTGACYVAISDQGVASMHGFVMWQLWGRWWMRMRGPVMWQFWAPLGRAATQPKLGFEI